jgi:hypothetical protein
MLNIKILYLNIQPEVIYDPLIRYYDVNENESIITEERDTGSDFDYEVDSKST